MLRKKVREYALAIGNSEMSFDRREPGIFIAYSWKGILSCDVDLESVRKRLVLLR